MTLLISENGRVREKFSGRRAIDKYRELKRFRLLLRKSFRRMPHTRPPTSLLALEARCIGGHYELPRFQPEDLPVTHSDALRPIY